MTYLKSKNLSTRHEFPLPVGVVHIPIWAFALPPIHQGIKREGSRRRVDWRAQYAKTHNLANR